MGNLGRVQLQRVFFFVIAYGVGAVRVVDVSCFFFVIEGPRSRDNRVCAKILAGGRRRK